MTLQARLLCGQELEIPAENYESIGDLRAYVATVLGVTDASVVLVRGSGTLSDEDDVPEADEAGITVVLSLRQPTRWLDEFLVDASSSDEEASASAAAAVQQLDAFGPVAWRLKQRVSVTPTMSEIAGVWKYGPNSSDDPGFYGMNLDADGSCRIVEGAEELDERDDSTGFASTCEWRGIWTLHDGEVIVEAFAVFEASNGRVSLAKPAAESTGGRFCLDAMATSGRARMKPAGRCTICRYASVPRSRGLLRMPDWAAL
eukprot:TRINITY_DN41349_c0_g1_i1.p1 TRINITY_DN41349_c0_g1~~TRINITY_DN41349_c0_g1_i1.p1  ORF type:complete len:259 (+),score=50.74 TRINITY_DN41349_c0_g1_i1:76-852(+)